MLATVEIFMKKIRNISKLQHNKLDCHNNFHYIETSSTLAHLFLKVQNYLW